jgi:hypothetical protein
MNGETTISNQDKAAASQAFSLLSSLIPILRDDLLEYVGRFLLGRDVDIETACPLFVWP